MNEIKIIPRHFGCISTSLDDGSKLPFGSKVSAIESWRSSTSKVRVFGREVPIGRGISFAKSLTVKPSLKAILDDFYLTIRTQSPLIIAPPSVNIEPICQEISEYASSKNMGISWAFYAYGNPADTVPVIIGITPSVAKILAQEIPEDVYLEDGVWQEWLFKWIKKYMQAHRYFDATRLGLVSLINEPVVIKEEVKQPECVCEVKKKRGRPAKPKQ